MTLEEEGSMNEEAMNSHDPQLNSNNLENIDLPLTERILEEEDWLNDGNDFGDADGNDFGEDDADLMDEDDLLGEDLQIEEEKNFQIIEYGMEESDMGAISKTTDGSGSGKVAQSAADTKNKTPRKVAKSPSDRVSGSSTKKKKGMRSPLTVGVSLKQRNLLYGLGSPKPFASVSGPNGSNSGQYGPSLSDNQKKTRVAAIPKNITSKVASGKPPKAP
ncbi:hypothetical protein YC2023_072628 [Brassica napus]